MPIGCHGSARGQRTDGGRLPCRGVRSRSQRARQFCARPHAGRNALFGNGHGECRRHGASRSAGATRRACLVLCGRHRLSPIRGRSTRPPYRCGTDTVLGRFGRGRKGEIAFDTDALLSQLGGGTFTLSEDGRSAELVSVLSLFNLQIPVRFTFLISEDGAVSLGGVQADLTLGGMQLGASLAYTETAVPALTEEEKEEYVSIVPYLSTVAQILSGDTIRLGVSYAAGDLSLDGTLDPRIAGGVPRQRDIHSALSLGKKTDRDRLRGRTIYLEMDGIRPESGRRRGHGVPGTVPCSFPSSPQSSFFRPFPTSLHGALSRVCRQPCGYPNRTAHCRSRSKVPNF